MQMASLLLNETHKICMNELKKINIIIILGQQKYQYLLVQLTWRLIV